jgi:hypothetical protein
VVDAIETKEDSPPFELPVRDNALGREQMTTEFTVI